MGRIVRIRSIHYIPTCLFLVQLLMTIQPCKSSVQMHDMMFPGFQRSQMDWIDNNGLFLLSNDSSFAFGFQATKSDVTQILLAVVHVESTTVVWTANRDSPVSNSDDFVFDGKVALLQGTKTVVWSPDTGGKPVKAIQMRSSGNLVLLGGEGNSTILWQSFSHPTDTLLSGQDFTNQGMTLSTSNSTGTTSTSTGNKNNKKTVISYSLKIESGDAWLFAGFRTPQPYWSMSSDARRVINSNSGSVTRARIVGNSWNLYDDDKGDGDGALMWQFIISASSSGSNNNNNSTTRWILVLGTEGSLNFYLIGSGSSAARIPSDPCKTPLHCEAFTACSSNTCSCPPGLVSRGCKTGLGIDPVRGGSSSCEGEGKGKGKGKDEDKDKDKDTAAGGGGGDELVYAGDGLSYVALDYVEPFAKKSDLGRCKASCTGNCSCIALFFSNDTGDCFLFDDMGSFEFRSSSDNPNSYSAYVKVASKQNAVTSSSSQTHTTVVVIISVATVVVVLLMVLGGYKYRRRHSNITISKRKKSSKKYGGGSNSDPDQLSSEEDNYFLETLSGMPVRFTYKELQSATNNFSDKLGQGGFGSVYRGVLPDGTQVAVKKLEGIGQGKKEFRAEVSIIGSIHHVHLVRLKGFCAEGSYRLLAYEFMPNGSLDKWIFRRVKEEINKNVSLQDDQEDNKGIVVAALDWQTRLNIALGTARGLAYLHEDCDSKIVHCDIKPENVLLDSNFNAKVSDFGLAKLMNREQSNVFTTLRGTRGYLAPEWITNCAISEKSDVYSYGMVLLEIIGGRKNYDPTQGEGKSHFPSFAFRMMEEGKVGEIVDSVIKYDIEKDESVCRAVKVALWCVQEEVGMRPSMAKVVQMLEGVCPVPDPPKSALTGSRLFSSFFDNKASSLNSTDGGTTTSTSVPSDYNSDTFVSAVRLSGPR